MQEIIENLVIAAALFHLNTRCECGAQVAHTAHAHSAWCPLYSGKDEALEVIRQHAPERENIMENIAEFISSELDYSGDPRFPTISEIRNVKRVKSEKHFQGYSFTFEACVNGKWESYGPDVCGNFTCRSDCNGRAWLPEQNLLYTKTDTRTIQIGWSKLNKYFGKLPLVEV